MFKFIITFILLGALGYGTDYFFRPSQIDLSKNLSNAFGLAFGISFMDVIFLKRREKKRREKKRINTIIKNKYLY